jgi:hypothetical protein
VSANTVAVVWIGVVLAVFFLIGSCISAANHPPEKPTRCVAYQNPGGTPGDSCQDLGEEWSP